jgi:hypothetical protein
MAFSDQLKTLVDQGLSASKEMLGKAGAKAQELGEIGMKKIELSQLQSKLTRLAGSLGAVAYKTFVEQNELVLSVNDINVKPLLDEIAQTRQFIEQKELELKNR